LIHHVLRIPERKKKEKGNIKTDTIEKE